MKKLLISALALSAAFAIGAQTAKELVITDKDGNEKTFPLDQVDGIIFQAQPEYIKLNSAFNAAYEETGPLGIYSIAFGTNVDEVGNPASKDDMVVNLVLAGPWSDNVQNPILPAGYYRVGRSDAEWTFDVTKSSITVLADDGPTPSMIIDGTVDVRQVDEGEYDIRMELTMFTGASVDLRYQGRVDFPKGFTDFQPFTEDVNVNYTHGQGRFWGNWYYPFAADLALQFFEGTIEDGSLQDGYMLNIQLYEPKPADEMAPNQKVADGTYSVETRDAVNYTYLPFRFDPGERTEFLGQTYITKTRLEYYGPDGSRKLGLVQGGTFTVSDNGSKFEFDFITEEGVHLKGSFNGTPVLQNFCDNDEKAPARPYSTLTENVTLNWATGTIAMSYNEGHSILDDANTMMLMFTHPSMETGDYISIDFFTESETIPTGTFTVGEELQVNKVIPGHFDFGGQMLFSWYGDLDEVDEDGYNTKYAPINAGTVTISDLGNNNYKVVFNVMDDNNHSITGEFSGLVINANEVEPSETMMKIIKQKKSNRMMRKDIRKRK